MLKRKTAVRLKHNIVGKPFKGLLSMQDVVGRSREDILDLLDAGWGLPMAGATVNQNQQAVQPIYFPRAVVVSTDQTIHQGDMVWWDAVNFTLKPLTSPNQVAIGATGGFCGIANGSNAPAVYPAPPDGTSENLPGITVQSGGAAYLNLQVNDVVDGPFQALTQAVDAQTVTRGGATSANRVGFAITAPPVTPRGAAGATPVSETVAGGGRIQVWLERKFPTTALV